MQKGTKRMREGTIKQFSALNQVIWKSDSLDIKQGALDIVAAMGDFAGANYDSISQLNKDLLNKEQEQKTIKQDLVTAEACHQEEVRLLKQEHEDKQKQSQKQNDYLKHQLDKSDLLNHQQANQIATLQQQLKESQLALATSSFSILTIEEFKLLACRVHDQFCQSISNLYTGLNEIK